QRSVLPARRRRLAKRRRPLRRRAAGLERGRALRPAQRQDAGPDLGRRGSRAGGRDVRRGRHARPAGGQQRRGRGAEVSGNPNAAALPDGRRAGLGFGHLTGDPAMRLILSLSLLALGSLPAFAQPGPVERVERGNRVTEHVPEIPAELVERLNRYPNTRGAAVDGWTRDDCLPVSTRSAETSQVHRVCQPLGMREQLTFHPEPVAQVTAAPADAPRPGFVFAKDRGGDEFSQLYWFDEQSRETRLLTDGGRNQNGHHV